MGTQSKVTQVGLDCHKNFSRAAARDQHGRVLWRARLEHADRQRLREQLRSWPAGTPVVLEGTFGWGWLSDELRDAKLDPHLANSRKVAGWRDTRGLAKSNKVDADLISELWSEQQRWWEVWLAPQEVRDRREWLRYRMTLVRMQSGIKNRIHATMHRHGIPHGFSDLFGVKGCKFLEQLTQDGRATMPPLREAARRTLAGYLQLLNQVRRQIAQVTRELRRQVRKDTGGELWRSLPGVSWVLAYTIMAEVGHLSRFKGGRKLSAYSLLVPLADDSGDEDPQAKPIGRHVGHIGRRTLKWAFIGAARGAVRKSAYFRAIYDRRTDGGKRDKGRGYIMVARELCRVGYSCVKNGRRFNEQRPAPPPPPPPPPPRRVEESRATDLLVRSCAGPDRSLAAAVV